MKKLMARTVKEISGKCIDTIPKGTVFELKSLGNRWSPCGEGIKLTHVYNDEFELIEEKNQNKIS